MGKWWASVLIIFALAGGTIRNRWSPRVYLRESTVRQCFDAVGANLNQENTRVYLTFTSTVSEGSDCWFGQDEQNTSRLKKSAQELIDHSIIQSSTNHWA